MLKVPKSAKTCEGMRKCAKSWENKKSEPKLEKA